MPSAAVTADRAPRRPVHRRYGAEALVTGRLGENAERALQAAGIPAYAFTRETTVSEALEAFLQGTLRQID